MTKAEMVKPICDAFIMRRANFRNLVRVNKHRKKDATTKQTKPDRQSDRRRRADRPHRQPDRHRQTDRQTDK